MERKRTQSKSMQLGGFLEHQRSSFVIVFFNRDVLAILHGRFTHLLDLANRGHCVKTEEKRKLHIIMQLGGSLERRISRFVIGLFDSYICAILFVNFLAHLFFI